jgi:hypothetical protein
MDTIIQSSIGRRRGGTHGCALDLMPGGISETKIAIFHYYFKCSQNGCMVVAVRLKGEVI